jgi:hypothetical protein
MFCRCEKPIHLNKLKVFDYGNFQFVEAVEPFEPSKKSIRK